MAEEACSREGPLHPEALENTGESSRRLARLYDSVSGRTNTMTASDPNRCERCGGPLAPSGPLAGSCPRCMMEIGKDSAVEGHTEPDSRSLPEEPEDARTSQSPLATAESRKVL